MLRNWMAPDVELFVDFVYPICREMVSNWLPVVNMMPLCKVDQKKTFNS